jgi:hypothetical protein
MTEHPAAPTTEASADMIRDCAAWGIDPSLAAAVAARIEQQAQASVLERARRELNGAAIDMRGWQDRTYRYIPEYRAAAILDSLSTDTREEHDDRPR